ncbi:unnamed protein product [Vitrella brassicaformis CCMP3155]|uniref:DUF676 domain-containing protein n=1 Tax=Vitrella brassicaformis (strain CCMP3155) TaxID=1169540 RepID=A0A0G4F3E5_VITBC|nr:unnamed protein product [Vitrella brassicaformis CCMP3155]|mmetsp:Transcript_17880/g.50835  ORF Transcript_17880/g.50835 Transcript_17880/m.50835 type:complete len:402 (-) Transcript_17880:1149-2354(-)|eukprot:CEM06714.1 unnamed protein product [Vitrella brassicaformis CCMP3155]
MALTEVEKLGAKLDADIAEHTHVPSESTTSLPGSHTSPPSSDPERSHSQDASPTSGPRIGDVKPPVLHRVRSDAPLSRTIGDWVEDVDKQYEPVHVGGFTTDFLEIRRPRKRALVHRHFVVLVHGVDGDETDWTNVHAQLKARHPEVCVLIPSVNVGRTSEGVDACASRLALFVQDHVLPDSAISFIGHSFGGVIARACVVRLERNGFLLDKSLKNFISIATPHVGIRECSPAVRVGAHILKRRTGSDLLVNNDRLLTLTEAKSLMAMARFNNLVAYGNLANDPLVGCRTALLLDDIPKDLAEQAKMLPGRPVEVPTERLDLACRVWDREPFRTWDDSGRSAHVRQMLQRLNTLHWRRYVVFFPSFLRAHTNIVWHGKLDVQGEGQHVVRHIVSEAFTKAF